MKELPHIKERMMNRSQLNSFGCINEAANVNEISGLETRYLYSLK